MAKTSFEKRNYSATDFVNAVNSYKVIEQQKAEQRRQEQIVLSGVNELASDYKVSTTPQIKLRETYDPNDISKRPQNITAEYQHIAPKGAPVNPDSDIKILDNEIYNLAILDRKTQEDLRQLKSNMLKAEKEWKSARDSTITEKFMNLVGGIEGKSDKEIAKEKYIEMAEKYYQNIYGTNEDLTSIFNALQAEKKNTADSEQKTEMEKDADDIGKILYGNSTVDNLLFDNATAGLTGASYEITATADALVGSLLKSVGWENNPISEYNNFVKSQYEYWANRGANAAAATGDTQNYSGQLIKGLVGIIPDTVMAIMTSGGSTATTSTLKAIAGSGTKTASTNAIKNVAKLEGKLSPIVSIANKSQVVANAASDVITSAAKNPMFWSSFSRTYGTDYEQAVNDGADEGTAHMYALITSLANALVEVGGGIQTLPSKLQGKSKSQILDWIKSSLEEGREEVVQSIISEMNEKLMYDYDKQIFSLTNEDAVINPKRLGTEFAMGTAIGGIAGGGQVILNSANNAKYAKLGKIVRKSVDTKDLIDYAKKSADENIRNIAIENNSGKISNRDLGILYSYAANNVQKAFKSASTIEEVNNTVTELANENNPKSINDIVFSAYLSKLTSLNLGEEVSSSVKYKDLFNLSAADKKVDPVQKSINAATGTKEYTADQNELKKIGQQFGAKVRFENLTNRTVDENGNEVEFAPEGQFDPDTNTITLNTDVRPEHRPAQFILKHELTHSMEKAGKDFEKFVAEVEISEAFENYAKTRINSKTGKAYTSLDEWYEDIANRYKKAGTPLGNENITKRTAAKYEAVADFVGDMLFTGDTKTAEQFFKGLGVESRNKFVAFVKDFFAKLKAIFSGDAELTEIERLEKQFLEVANKVAKMNVKENKSVDLNAKKSYSFYDEYATNIAIWVNSASTKPGDVKIFNTRNGFALLEATVDGYIELARGNYKEVKSLEQQYREPDNSIYVYTEVVRNGKTRKSANDSVVKEFGKYEQGGRQTGSQRLQSDTAGNNDNLRRGNKGKQSVKFSLPEKDIKQSQLDIIKETNPMWDDYHTGIRTVDDIHTWEEVLELDDEREGQFVWGDFSREDAEQALKDGTITVYSSYPIKNGTFVSTSYIQAQEYAGEKNGKVYSKTIPLNDVAWINGDEGQYAKTDNIRYSLPDNATPLQIGNAYKNGEISEAEYERLINQSWEKQIKQEGAIEQGEMVAPPNKPNPTPTSVKPNTKVSEHIRTILESGYASKEMETYLKEKILDGLGSFTPTSNEKDINKAARKIQKQGYQNALNTWRTGLDNLTVGSHTVTQGEALLRLAMEQNNAVDIVNISADLAELSTRTAQSLQAFSLLKRMGGIGQLVYIQRSVNKLNQDLQKRSHNKADNVKVDKKLAERLAKAETEGEYETIYNKIMQDVADQVPATFLDKWNAWRYMAMLFNPTTHVRNISGNAIFVPAVRMKDLLALAGEKAFVKQENRTKSLKVKKEYQDFASKDFEQVKSLLTGTGKYNPTDDIKEHQKIFKNKVLEGLRRLNFNLLEAEDALFLKRHYRHALGGFLQARKLDLNNLTSKQLAEARNYAFSEALKATYRDASMAANIISQLSKLPVGNVLVEGVLPFKKTPINVLKRGMEYSPVGLVKTLSLGLWQLNTGKITATQFIDGLAAGVTGTGLTVLGALLASLGIIKGGFDDEETLDRLMGKQEYSIQIGDKSYTIDWAAPASIPFFMGVAAQEYKPEEDGDFLTNLYNFGIQGFEPILNLSMLSGINDVINSVSYADSNENLPQIVGAAIGSYFSQLLPTIFGKTANVIDDTRRMNYIDKTLNVPELVQSALNKIYAKTPWLSKNRAEYIDAWGETKYTGNFFERFFQQFVSPGYASTVDEKAISEEALRLYRETGDKSVIPSTPAKYFEFNGTRRNLSKEEYFDYATLRGQMQADIVSEAINSETYKKLNDEQKALVVSTIYSFANAYAKTTLKYSYEEVAAMVGKDKNEEYILTKEKWDKLDDKAKRVLVNDKFFNKKVYEKAYKAYQKGESVSEVIIKQVLKDTK